MVTIDELLGWHPEALRTSADTLNKDRRTLLDLQDEMDAAYPPSSWIGQAAEGARSAHTRLYDRLADMVAALSPVIEALDTAEQQISAARRSVQSAKDTISMEGWQLTESGGSVTVTAPPGEASNPITEMVDEGRMTALAQQIADALADAETADQDLAGTLRSAKLGQFDGGSGSLADAALPPELRNLSDQELVDYFMEHPEESNSYTDGLTTQQQQLLGRSIAAEYDGLAGGELYTEGGSEDYFPTDGEVSHLNDLLEAFGGDSTVATSLMNQLGPDGVLAVQQGILTQDPNFERHQSLSPDVIGESQRLWGQTMAAATSGTGAGGGGTTEHVSDDYLQQLIDRGDDQYNLSSTYAVSGYELLGPLLRDDGHSSHVLNQVGDAMEQYEKDYLEENEVSPWDRGMGEPQLDFTHGEVSDVVTVDGEEVYDVPSGHDPFGGLMEGLSHNPEAARDFFSHTSGAYEDRVDWYMNGRDWPHAEAEGSGWPTSQRYFGDALVTATTVEPTPESVDLAERAVAAASGHIEVSENSDDQQHLTTDLRQTMGTITSAYMPDVYDALRNGGDVADWLPEGADPQLRADFDTDQMREVLAEVGRDEQAGNEVAGAASTYANMGYDHYLGGEDGTWDQRMQVAADAVSDPYAGVVSALGEGYSEELRDAGAAADAAASGEGDGAYQAAGWVADQITGELTGKIPFVGGAIGDLASTGIDGAVDGLTGMNDVDTSQEVRENIGSHLADTRGSYQAMVDQAVYRNVPVDQLPPELVQDGSAVPMSQWSQDQVDAWVELRGTPGSPAYAALHLTDGLAGDVSDGQDQTERGQGD